jgi:murein L,D-transpeptidase YafK
MRNVFILLMCFAFSCQQQAQENSNQGNKSLKPEQETFSARAMHEKGGFDQVRIDTVANIAKGTNELTSAFIKKRLQALIANYLKEKCAENGINYPPKFVLFRCFKYEKEFEVWAGNSNKDSLRRILFLGVCAVDKYPGTKLQMGDGKTPEGFYNCSLQYGSPNWFMWIKLNNSEIDNYGTVSNGSSFKMCLDYPNALDKKRTNTLLKAKSPGNAICIHGNCVTAGCISFRSRDFLPIFLAALSHNSATYGSIKIHIFPFRFDNVQEKKRIELAENVQNMKPEQVIETWKNLEIGYNLFNKTQKALKVNILNNKTYSYAAY